MRVLFYIQRVEDAHLAQALALHLKEEAGATAFAAMSFRAMPEQGYLAEHAGNLFTDLLSETEMCDAAKTASLDPDSLTKIEADYDLPFWQYVTQDRFLTMERANYLFSYGTRLERETQQKHIQVRFSMTEAFVERFKPDVVFFIGVDVGPSSALILERVAKRRDIPVLVPLSAKIGSYHFFIDTVFSEAKHLEQRFKALQQGVKSANEQKAKELIAEFREGNVVLPYVQNVKVGEYKKKLEPAQFLKRLVTIAKLRLQARGVYHHKFGDVYNLSQLEYERFRLGIEYRNFRLKFGQYFKAASDEPFIFFPLHVEPELALLLYAPFHTNQLTTIQNVAQSLPWDTCLYVKEHPQGVGKKDMEFYRRLATMPNVKSIYPHTNSRSLIQQSKGVITITSTVGMEAMLFGKPAITLGDVFYNFVDKLVWRADRIEDVAALVRKFPDFKPDEAMLESFVTAILDESVNIDPEVLALAMSKESLDVKRANPDFLTYAAFTTEALLKATGSTSNKPQTHDNSLVGTD